jgi:1-acyl-sn-glycerol-3-phosphate acyltransferase
VLRRREKGGFWVAFAAVVIYPLGWLVARARYEGRQHLPADGGALVVANHISHLDPVYSALFVHSARRVPRFLAKHSLWRVPLLRWVLVGSGQIPVYRDSADARQSLREGTNALQEGKVVVIYPEGTITKDPTGWPMRAHTGAARLALDNDVPVLTAARWGTNHILDGYTKKFRPFPRKRIHIDVSEPVDLSAYRDRPVTNELLREVTDLLMSRVKDQLAKIRQEQAPDGFYEPAKARRRQDDA